MNRKNNRRRMNKNEISKKVMRCNDSHKIVWDNQCCNNYIAKDTTLNLNNCKNCKYSY